MGELRPAAAPLQLPRFDMVGPHIDVATTAIADLAYIRRHKTVDRYPDELPRSAERGEQLQSITQALGHFLTDLGVRVAPEKIPSPQRFHFFADKQKMNAALDPQEDQDRYAHASGAYDGSNIFVVEDGKELSYAGHEAIHFMAYESWRLHPIQKRILLRNRTIYGHQQVREGYSVRPNGVTPVRFALMHELLIEMTHIYVQQRYWREHANLPVANQFEPGYILSLIIGEEMIKKAAADQNVDPKDVFLPLAKGLFTGDMKALRALCRAVGTAGFKAAAHAQVMDGGFGSGFDLAAKIGVPQVKDRFDDAEQSGVLPAFEWM